MIRLFSTLLIVAMLSECKGSEFSCETKCIDNCRSGLTAVSHEEEYLLNPEAYIRSLMYPEGNIMGPLHPEAEKKCLLDPLAKVANKWSTQYLSEDDREALLATFAAGVRDNNIKQYDELIQILKQQYAIAPKSVEYVKDRIQIMCEIGDVYVKKGETAIDDDDTEEEQRYFSTSNENKLLDNVKHLAYVEAKEWYEKAMKEVKGLNLHSSNPLLVRVEMGFKTAQYKLGDVSTKRQVCKWARLKEKDLKKKRLLSKSGKAQAENNKSFEDKLGAWRVLYFCSNEKVCNENA